MENLKNQECSKDNGSKRVLRLKGFTVEIMDNEFRYFPTQSSRKYYVISKHISPEPGYGYLDMVFKDKETDKVIDDPEMLRETFRTFTWDISYRFNVISLLLERHIIVKDEVTKKYIVRLPKYTNEELLGDIVTTVKIPGNHTELITPVEYKHFRVSYLSVNSYNVSMMLVSSPVEVRLEYTRRLNAWSIENISFTDMDSSLSVVYYIEELDRALSKFRLENHFLWIPIDNTLKRYEDKFQASLKETIKIDPSSNEIREEKILLFSTVNRILDKAGKGYEDYKIIYKKG